MAAGVGGRQLRGKLYNMQPSVQLCKRVSMPAADDIKLTRLRLGHTALASELVLVGKHPNGKQRRKPYLELEEMGYKSYWAGAE